MIVEMGSAWDNQPWVTKALLANADLDERQDLYTKLANECWSPKRLMEV